MLGRFLEISVHAPDVRESLEFYQALGFEQATTSDSVSYPYAVVTDGRLFLGLHAAELPTPSLTFVMPELRKTFAQQPVADLQSNLDAAGVPNGPINNLKQVFEMPQAAERQLKIDVPRSDGVRVAGVRNPIRLSATPVEYRHAAPRLGEHTDAVLAEWLEADSAEIARLRASGAFGQ